MNQKLLIRVSMNNQKSRSKAMNTVVGVHGVNSASLTGPEKTQIEVTGHAIDSVALVTLLRKKVGFAELVSVGPLQEEEEEEDKPEDDSSQPPPPAIVWSYGYAGGLPHYIYNNDPYSCAIL